MKESFSNIFYAIMDIVVLFLYIAFLCTCAIIGLLWKLVTSIFDKGVSFFENKICNFGSRDKRHNDEL